MARQELTQKIVDQAGEELKRVFCSKAKEMREAFIKYPGKLGVAMQVAWTHSENEHQINADIKIKFKQDEVNDQESFTFVDTEPLFDYEERAAR